MYPETPSFGTMIRAARLGWGYVPGHGCFMRLSDAEGVNTRVELCPMHQVPREQPKGSYRVWWENDREILAMIPWLKNVRSIKRYLSFVIDTNGEILPAKPATH